MYSTVHMYTYLCYKVTYALYNAYFCDMFRRNRKTRRISVEIHWNLNLNVSYCSLHKIRIIIKNYFHNCVFQIETSNITYVTCAVEHKLGCSIYECAVVYFVTLTCAVEHKQGFSIQACCSLLCDSDMRSGT